MTTVAIMVPMPSEFKHYDITGDPDAVFNGHAFHRVSIEGVNCIVGQSGIGKVNMAVATTLMMENYAPDVLINAGVGGAIDRDLQIGDVVISDTMVCSDYGRITDGEMFVYQPGGDPFPGADETRGYHLSADIKQKITAGLNNEDFKWGTIATGDVFVNCPKHVAWLRDALGASAVAMEGVAMAQVAEKYGVPSLEIRAFSDTAQGDSTVEFDKSLPLAAANAAKMCRRVVALFA